MEPPLKAEMIICKQNRKQSSESKRHSLQNICQMSHGINCSIRLCVLGCWVLLLFSFKIAVWSHIKPWILAKDSAEGEDPDEVIMSSTGLWENLFPNLCYQYESELTIADFSKKYKGGQNASENKQINKRAHLKGFCQGMQNLSHGFSHTEETIMPKNSTCYS